VTEENPYSAPETAPDADVEAYRNESEDAHLSNEEFEDSEEIREPASYEYADFLRRASAKMIDIICFNLAFFFIFIFVSVGKSVIFPTASNEAASYDETFPGDRASPYFKTYEEGVEWERMQLKDEAPTGLSDRMLGVISIAAFMVFAALSEWRSGQSIGKLLLGIQVVGVGPPSLPSLGMALGRNVGLLFDGMFVGLFAYFVMRTNPRKQRSGDIGAGTLVVRKRSIPGSPLSRGTDLMQGLMAGVLSIIVVSLVLLMIDPTL
jgi:hypothetical protein